MTSSNTVILLDDSIPHREVFLFATLLLITVYNSFVLYVIRKQTPSFMKEYKLYLIQTVAAFIFFEWTVFCGYFPYMIQTEDGRLVAISASLLSLSRFKIPLPALTFLFGHGIHITLHSNARSFFFRMMAVQPKQRKKMLNVLFYTLFTVSFGFSEACTGLMSFYYLEATDQEYGFRSTTDSYIVHQTAYLVNFEKIRRTYPAILVVICTGVGGTITMIFYTYHCLYSQQNVMSLRTRIVQRKLFWGLFTQWWTTILVSSIPVFLMLYMTYSSLDLANIFNISCLLCFTACGLSLPTVVLLSYRPYGQFILKLLQNVKIVNRPRTHSLTTVDPSIAQTGRLWIMNTPSVQ